MSKKSHLAVRWILVSLVAVGILIYLIAPYLGWGIAVPFLQRDSELYPDPDMETYAVFDWSDTIKGEVSREYSHLTLDLNYHTGWNPSGGEQMLLESQPPLMITLRTWSHGADTYQDNPLNDIVDGKYDAMFRELARSLPRGGEGVYLRFNPNVEVPVKQYPWQQYPRIFIESFRRLASICRKLAPAAKLVWAPAGYPGAMEYYPGDDVVDAASVTYRYAAEEKLDAYPTNVSPDEDLYRRLHRLRFLRVPIFVLTEEGYQGNYPDIEEVVGRLGRGAADIYGTPPKAPSQAGPRSTAITVGLYDPQQRLLEAPEVEAEHIFTDFEHIRDGRFDSLFQAVNRRGHATIVTFEPFTRPIEESDTNVLTNVTAGQYDPELLRVFATLAAANQQVYFRYAHEMEIPIHRYPWQSRDPQDYITSFRYVMAHDSMPANVTRIWGPAGDRGFLEWYPGDDYVDMVSIAIYGLPDKNITDPTKQESFEVIFKRKMWRMRFVDKPVFITEFGVKGPEEYQTQWMEAAARVLAEDTRVVGINYFNMSDTPKAWGDIKPPDWSITRATLDRFVAVLHGTKPSKEESR
ncbi:hypothetical protein [Lewinella sp. IMCC34191]|uniref:hypothetical protein n=1 Tax=Lewinella sp. IMCC34191 TaxID=2259172 RepID=UPI000E2633E2|nr:hypothetical protein [Lewinella sp. IMCC34191]